MCHQNLTRGPTEETLPPSPSYLLFASPHLLLGPPEPLSTARSTNTRSSPPEPPGSRHRQVVHWLRLLRGHVAGRAEGTPGRCLRCGHLDRQGKDVGPPACLPELPFGRSVNPGSNDQTPKNLSCLHPKSCRSWFVGGTEGPRQALVFLEGPKDRKVHPLKCLNPLL